MNSRGRTKGLNTWRRKQCQACKAMFTTTEAVDTEQAIRVKKVKALEPFIYEKLFLDVYDSLRHRKTAHIDAKRLSATIMSKLMPCKSGVIEKEEIQTTALGVLKRFDKAAATYYAAHHKPTS
ncbi:MAG TPA: hypothetical protein VFX86_04290 [Candidatus Saccharimonadales bacterium]|nr:hypothetical protein [Candidatus Saccharimonadales bacterium]